jgi:hypothetical protein
METRTAIKGGCLCGRVRYEIKGPSFMRITAIVQCADVSTARHFQLMQNLAPKTLGGPLERTM